MASRIEDYGLIGNTRTAALVSRNGSIDWFCGPRFDSDACFAALLGYDKHGSWSLRPTVSVRENRQRYRKESLVLETEFACDGGLVRITDFMPMIEDRCDVVRLIEGIEGEVTMEMVLNVRFGYGADKPWVVPSSEGYNFTSGPDAIFFRGPVSLREVNGRAVALITVKKGDRIPLQINWRDSHTAVPGAIDVDQSLNFTDNFWREWAGRCAYQGRWRDLVVRSLITLKAMTYAPTGGIVAAPTTSLPEAMGGVRNWDYRFCWLRDSSLTLDALMIGGYTDEAGAFRDWLMRAAAGDPAGLQIMYDIRGSKRLTEFNLPWLPGYEGSSPVHVATPRRSNSSSTSTARSCACIYVACKQASAGQAGDGRR